MAESSAERWRFSGGRDSETGSSGGTHVAPSDPVLCKAVCDELLHHHRIYVQPINYPTVPRGTERLRLTPSPLHSVADIDDLVRALAIIWSELDLPPRPPTARKLAERVKNPGAAGRTERPRPGVYSPPPISAPCALR